MRKEKDSLGELTVPDDALYGVHTCRSIENFHMAGEKLPLELIYAIVQLKQACAAANAQLGLLPHEKAVAIAAATGFCRGRI